jgi:RNA polymerase sigma-B factor
VNEFAVAEHLRLLPDPAAGFRQDLSGLGDRELLALVGSLPRSSHRRAAALDLLVARYRKLVRSCVQRYARKPQATEDLMQVGYVGLLKAINNFDPALGFSLAAYAGPCIAGELKRHFRDKSWPLRVERQLQERVLEVRQTEQVLTQQLGRVPTDCELAGDLGVGAADVREARQAELVLQPMSLDEPARGQPGAASLSDLLGEEDPRLEHMLGMQAIATHWGELPVREQRIVVLYYYRGMTQTQIGQQLGVSQMQVSRLLARTLSYLRPRLLGQPACVTETVLDPAPRTDLPGRAPRPRRAGRAPRADGAFSVEA